MLSSVEHEKKIITSGPDQDLQSVSPDLGPNYLLRSSADNKIFRKQVKS